MEGDPEFDIIVLVQLIFQSTPSAWRETIGTADGGGVEIFQSTPSAWRETNNVGK